MLTKPMPFKPMPFNVGIGVFSLEPLNFNGYKYEKVGRYHNYYFTKENWQFPSWPWKQNPNAYIIDGFSPNLNKELHVGHLRQLALACSLSKILNMENLKFVSMFGKSLGVLDGAQEKLQDWFDFVGFHPQFCFDTDLKEEIPMEDGVGKQEGCKVWQGPNGPVIVIRSDGRSTYAHHDLMFAKAVSPTHYITGAEQQEHFKNIGLGDKHFPMGLVVGADNKKIKSRTGDALSAQDAIQMVMANLDKTPEPKKLAWNLLAWNFLHTSRGQNAKFEAEKWVNPDAPGMYISYTYARLKSALSKISVPQDAKEFQENDLLLLGQSEYYWYWLWKAMDEIDTAAFANYLFDLAKVIGNIYHKERIVDGRPELQFAMNYAMKTLGNGMSLLGMFLLEEI